MEDILTYIVKKLAEKVSRADMAKMIRSQASYDCCIKSVRKERKEQEAKQKQGGFVQSAGSEATVLSGIAKSPGFSDLSKMLVFHLLERTSSGTF